VRTLAVFEKELMEVLKNRLLLFTVIPLPLVFAIMPLAFVYFTGDQPLDDKEVDLYLGLSPAFANMNPVDVFQIVLMGQFMFLLLLAPTIVPMTIATFSIVGEKQARSLEPVLATPIRTWELLLGKALAAVAPAVVITWICYGILLAGMAIIARPLVFASVASGVWPLAIGVLTPLLAVLTVNVGVMISSRVNDTRVAQQIGGMIVLPLVGLSIAQAAGWILFNLQMFALGTVVLILLDVGVLVAATRLFQRETILVRWK
jgi:ABC-type Na+ efflux pump permease subunit